MEQLQISVKSSLKALKDTVDEFAKINRGDKKVLYDIYLSEYTSLITYLEETSIPSIFKRNELQLLLNKIEDEVSSLKKILSCYSDLEKKRHQLETDFNIVEKSTVLYHHLEDLNHTMKIYLGFDKIDKFRSVETMFEQVIEKMKAQKKKRFQLFQNELLELKDRIQKTQSDETGELIKRVEYLLNELNTSEVFNQRKAFLIKQELDDKERLSRKRLLRKNILNRVRTRILSGADLVNENSLEDFEVELEKIKQSANVLFK